MFLCPDSCFHSIFNRPCWTTKTITDNKIFILDTRLCLTALSLHATWLKPLFLPLHIEFLWYPADESTTDSQISVKGAAAAKDTTRCDRSSESTIVSFKLPSVLDGYHNPPGSQRTGSSSSSSGDDADTVPFSRAVPGKYLSMSTKKPTAKTTPNCKSGESTKQAGKYFLIAKPKSNVNCYQINVFSINPESKYQY